MWEEVCVREDVNERGNENEYMSVYEEENEDEDEDWDGIESE